MPAKAIGDDAGDGVGRPSGSTRRNDGNGACWKGLGVDAGGGEHGCPGGENLAALHGFLLLWPGGPVPSSLAAMILAGPRFGAKGACYRNLTRSPP